MIKVIIPEKSLEAIAKIVFKRSRRMFTRKYSDLDILRVIIAMYLTKCQYVREFYDEVKRGNIYYPYKLPSRQTLMYRMKYIDKTKISGMMKKVAGSILAIDSSELRNKKERLHALYNSKEKVIVDFEVSERREWDAGVEMTKGCNGSLIIGDRGYHVEKFRAEGEGEKLIRPRGRAGEEFMKSELMRAIYRKRWEIEYYFERLKLGLVIEKINKATLFTKLTIRLIGQELTYLIGMLKKQPKLYQVLFT